MRHKVGLGFSMAAIAWSVALLVGAATLPFYSGSQVSLGCPGCPEVYSEQTRTLLEVNGPRVLLVVGVPLAMSLLVAITLWTGRPSVAGAWVLIALLWFFSLLAIVSIGMFVAPAALLLTLAAALAGKSTSRGAATSMP